MSRMPKKKLKKQSDEALLLEVKKEMARPRAAESTRSEDLNEDDPPIVPRSPKEKAMRNRWLAFLMIAVAVIAMLFAHGGRGGVYLESGPTNMAMRSSSCAGTPPRFTHLADSKPSVWQVSRAGRRSTVSC